MRKYIAIILLIVSVQFSYASNVISLPYLSAGIVYSKVQGKLYAVISAMDTEYGNRLLEINTNTGEVERSLFVGSEPNFVRLTSDENFVWISFLGIPFVKRVNLNTFEIDKEVFLGPSKRNRYPKVRNSHIITSNFTVFPNDNNKLAIGLNTVNIFDYEGIALYKNDTMQPNRIERFDSFSFPLCFESLANGNYLVGHYESSIKSVFSTIKVLDDGLDYESHFENLIEADTRRNWIKVYNDTLCIADGTVLDATDISNVTTLGNCDNDIIGDYYGFTYSDIHSAFAYPNINNKSIYLTFYNKNTFVAYESVFLLDYDFDHIMIIPYLEVIDRNTFAILIGKDYGYFTIRIIETREIGTEEISTNEQIEIYPNPASNKLFIEGLPLNKRIYVYDITGKLIETYEHNGMNAEITLKKYHSGTYLLRITDVDNKSIDLIRKIVVQ